MKTHLSKQIIFILILLFITGCIKNSDQIKSPNILFIAVDDLRPELNCFGNKWIHSPNIDRIAAEGILFQRAYCQVPVCGASRASLLTGIRPNRTRFVTYDTWAEKDAPGIVSLPHFFKNNGYHTISNGKIFHHRMDMADSWSEEPWQPAIDLKEPVNWRDYQSKENIIISNNAKGYGPAYEKLDTLDYAYFDGKVAEKSIKDLIRLKEEGQPFFLAVGFYKPHLPFNAPEKYWDLYKSEDIKTARNPKAPENAPFESIHNWGELRAYTNIPKEGPLPDSLARSLVHGYYACVSYTDAQIGKIYDTLKTLGLDSNTIIIIWGDHGWNLGEHGLWCKHCNYETSLRAPIIIKSPAINGGEKSQALVEFIDIYPTLCEMANLQIPNHIQGKSLVPFLSNPELPGKNYVYSRFHSGESVKSNQYRYTEWMDSTNLRYAEMLYDHKKDPSENLNIIKDLEYQKTAALLRKMNAANRDSVQSQNYTSY